MADARRRASACRTRRSRCRATLYGAARANSRGIDLANETRLAALALRLAEPARAAHWTAAPLLGVRRCRASPVQPVLQPGRPPRHRRPGARGQPPTTSQAALRCAAEAAPTWPATPPAERAATLERAADLLEADTERLMGLLAREAGKTCANAIAEVREAVDFLRYYALQVRRDFDNATHRPLGPVVCISPWNFPLAIFTGQVAAALAAGNPVLAKPAEQTPLIAAAGGARCCTRPACRAARCSCCPAAARPSARALVGRRARAGRDVHRLDRGRAPAAAQLAGGSDADGRPVPLIAETGGQNAMIVDSSALAEQVVVDVRRLGLRQRRPALLGAARAVRAGRRRPTA